MKKIFINANNYSGKYIAIKNPKSTSIISYGLTPQQALNKARKKGVENPFLLYIPDKNLVHIYYAS